MRGIIRRQALTACVRVLQLPVVSSVFAHTFGCLLLHLFGYALLLCRTGEPIHVDLYTLGIFLLMTMVRAGERGGG
jgi:hypothetical protein